jgi:hypothetical protein
LELQAVEVSFEKRTRDIEKNIAAIRDDITANKQRFQSQLEEFKAVAGRGSRPTVSVNTAQPPTLNGNTLRNTFQCQFEIVAEHNQWSDREKLMYLITALKGRVVDVLPGIPTSTTYEDMQNLEDRFSDQHFAAAHRCQLATRTQKVGESLQDFAMAIELLAHRAYPTLPEDLIGREVAKAFAYGVEDPDIKIHYCKEERRR